MYKDLIDYALPLMQTEKSVKRVYDRLLEGKPEEAMEEALETQSHLLDAMLMIRKEMLEKRGKT
jgi:hypothetical protein